MEAEQVYEVLTKLIGNTKPQGCSTRDGESNKNLKTYIEVFRRMHKDIDDIAFDNKDCHEHSIKEAVKLCNDQLDDMGITQ